MTIQTIPADLNRKIGKALHDYDMLVEGDRVLVAVSGGVDSLVLAVVLKLWQAKAPISFELFFVHVDHGFDEDGAGLEKTIIPQLSSLGIELRIVKELSLTQKRSCFICAKNRRKLLFDLAKQEAMDKIALGHHRDDLVETFLINAFYGGNISTMRPHQELFNGTLSLLRPLSYLEKKDIQTLANLWHLSPIKNSCPFEQNTKRETVRRFITHFYREEPTAKDSIFAALFNVRLDYLP